jgi:hypothetical protein
MILVDTTTRRLRICLAGSGALPFVASFVAITSAAQRVAALLTVAGETNGTTPVDVVPYPLAGTVRQLRDFYLRASAAATVRLCFDDNGTIRYFASFALDSGDVLQYTDGEGFRVFDSTGAVKGQGSSGGGDPVPAPDYDAQQMALLALMGL